MQKHPALKLNLGHFGGDIEWEKLAKGDNNTWASRIFDMMARYENLYADLSYSISQPELFDVVKRRIEDNALIAERTLYGSDYSMVVVEGHFRSIKTDFIIAMGDQIMNQIAGVNPRNFLFT